MRHRFWANHTASDFATLDHANLIAMLPVGAIEQHGPHLPLSVDQAILDGLISATLPLLADDCPVLFLPTLPVGKSNEHAAWPGTLTFSAQTLTAMWREIGDCVAAAGVRKLVLLHSHGGQIAPLDIVARDLRVKHRMLTVAANWFAMGLPDGILTPEEERFGIHAGDLETSMMLALHPDLVRMERARNFVPQTIVLSQDYHLLGLSAAAKLGWQAQDLNAVVALTARHKRAGRVLCGHACALAVRPADEVARQLDLAAKAGVALTVLPTTSLHLQDMAPGRTPRLRGLAPLLEARAAGVRVVLGADNVADAFYPRGSFDQIEVLRPAALAAHLAPADWIDAISTDAARVMGLPTPRIAAGAPADFLLIAGADWDAALRSPTAGRKDGTGGGRNRENAVDVPVNQAVSHDRRLFCGRLFCGRLWRDRVLAQRRFARRRKHLLPSDRDG